MAFPTAVNNQVTDAVTQTNAQVLGEAPALSAGEFFVATSQAFANAAHNATFQGLQSNITSLAANAQGVATLLGIDTAADTAEARVFNPLKNSYPR